jgi:hypothetical protein
VAGVPLSVAVPFPLLVNVTPLGSVPVSLSVGVGLPVAVPVNVPAVPTVNVVLLPLVIAGAWLAWLIVSVKLCVAAVPTPLLAVIVNAYVPAVPVAGVPPSVAVPLPLFVNVTPLGSAPLSLIDDTVGFPVVAIVKLPAVPTVNVVLAPLVIAGAWLTVSVKLCVAAVPTPLLAVIVSGYVPPVPVAGVPPSVAVPFPLFVNVTPLGNVPVSLSVGVGLPVAVTVNVPAVPTVNVVLLPLVSAGAVPVPPLAALNATICMIQSPVAAAVAL